MESIGQSLQRYSSLLTEKRKVRPPTRLWSLAEEIGKLTGTKPQRWLRDLKKNEVYYRRAMDNMKELSPKNPAAYLIWLVKHYRNGN